MYNYYSKRSWPIIFKLNILTYYYFVGTCYEIKITVYRLKYLYKKKVSIILRLLIIFNLLIYSYLNIYNISFYLFVYFIIFGRQFGIKA